MVQAWFRYGSGMVEVEAKAEATPTPNGGLLCAGVQDR